MNLDDTKVNSRKNSIKKGNLISPCHGFGFNGKINHPLKYLNENQIVAGLGYHIAIQTLHPSKMHFLAMPATNTHQSNPKKKPNNQRFGEVSALAVSGRQEFIAVCRKAYASLNCKVESTVCVYQVHFSSLLGNFEQQRGKLTSRANKRSLSFTEKNPKRTTVERTSYVRTLSFPTVAFIDAAFSYDGKLLACQTATSDWEIIVWDWFRRRKIALTDLRARVSKLSFNPIDKAQISTSGSIHLRVWTISGESSSLKLLAAFTTSQTQAKYTDHVWMKNDQLIAILENNEIQVIKNLEIVQTIKSVHVINDNINSLLSITSYNDGIVVGGCNGWISFYEIDHDLDSRIGELRKVRRIKIAKSDDIMSLSIDPSESSIICCSKNNFGSYKISNMSLLRGDDEEIELEYYSKSSYSSTINSVSFCPRNCLVAAISQIENRMSISIWNFKTKENCVMHRCQHLYPVSLDFHPSGYEMVVGFSSRVQLYYILHDSIELFCEINAKQCTLVKFSPQGNIFSVICSDKVIYLYSMYGRNIIPVILAKVQSAISSPICRLNWSSNNLSFYTVHAQGDVSVWDLPSIHGTDLLNDCGRVLPHEIQFHVFSANCSNNVVVAAGNAKDETDSSMNIYLWESGDVWNCPAKICNTRHKITELRYIINGDIIASTASGDILILTKVKDESTSRNYDMDHYEIHGDRIIGLALSSGEDLILSGSVDGSIFLSDFRALTGSSIDSDDVQGNRMVLLPDEVCVVSKSKVVSNNILMCDLEEEIKQVKLALVVQEKDLLGKHTSSMSIMERRIQSLNEFIQINDSKVKENLHDIEVARQKQLLLSQNEYDTNIKEYQDIFIKKIAEQDEAYKRVLESEKGMKIELEDKIISFDEQLFVIKQELRNKHETEKVVLQQKITELENHIVNMKKQFEATLSQQEEESSKQLHSLQNILHNEKNDKTTISTSMNSSLNKLRYENRVLLNDLEEKQSKILELNKKVDCLRDSNKLLLQKSEKQDHTIVQIDEKRNEIENKMKLQVNDIRVLERTQEVCYHEMESVQKELEPKERKIEKLNFIIANLQRENDRIYLITNELDQKLVESSFQLKAMKNQFNEKNQETKSLKSLIIGLYNILDEIITDIPPNRWNSEICKLREKMTLLLHQKQILIRQVEKQLKEFNTSNHRTTEELVKQKYGLEQHIISLKNQNIQLDKQKTKKIESLRGQNINLLKEVNQLRKESHDILTKSTINNSAFKLRKKIQQTNYEGDVQINIENAKMRKKRNLARPKSAIFMK